MASYNQVTLVGVLHDNPEEKTIGKKKRTTFILAVERYLGKEKKPAVDYFNIVVWGKLAEVCSTYLQKGKKVLVDGKIQIRTMSQDGERKWITEIIGENIKFLSTNTPDTNLK